MSKMNINFTISKRGIAALLAFITVAVLFVPVISLYSPEAFAMSNNTEYTPDDTYITGTDFENLAEGMTVGTVTEAGKTPPESAGPNYEYKVDNMLMYKIVSKRSYLRVISENGNKFVRAYRTPVGGSGTTSNDIYYDFEDPTRTPTGDFVAEASYRFVEYPAGIGDTNLMQFINRDNGSIFQGLLTMQENGNVVYKTYNESNGKDKNVNTGFVMTLGEWFHVCVAVHRNDGENVRDSMDVYINGELIAAEVPLTNQINAIYQFRVAQSSGGAKVSCVYDVDNVWIYKGSEPTFTVGSGMDKDKLLGELDYTDPALTVGGTIAGKVTTDKFEIDAKNDLFTVNKDTWRKLLKMDQSRGEPYVDVFADGAKGSVVLDMGLILGNDWSGRAELLTPFSETDGYVTREGFLTIDSSRTLYDRDGKMIAELGTGVNRIALAFSADRSLATLFVNGKQAGKYDTKYGFAYTSIDGMRAFQIKNSTDAGTAYIYYAEIYGGTQPALIGGARQDYFADFDGVESVETPLQLVGDAKLGSGNAGIYTSASKGSAVRYASSVNTDGLTVSFAARVDSTAGLELLKLGDSSIATVGGDRRITVHTADGDKALFKMEQGKEYFFTFAFDGGKFSVYADGLPFVSNAKLPAGVGNTASLIDFVSVATAGDHYAYIDLLEIYTGGDILVTSAPVPIVPEITVKDHKAYLSWSSVVGAIGYRVYRSATAEGGYTDVSGRITDDFYTDPTVVSGVKYFYKVVAEVNISGEVFVLGEDAEPTEFEDTDPALDVVAVGTNSGIKLSWKAFSGANLGYSVYRSFQIDGEYTAIAEKISATEYTDAEAIPGLVIYYKVCVVIDRNGAEFIFGLDGKAIEAVGGEVEDDPTEPPAGDDPTDDPTDPTDPEGGDESETLPTDPDGVNIPEANAEKLFGTDFEKPLAEIGGLTAVGSGFAYQTVDGGNAVQLTVNGIPTENKYLSVIQTPLASLSMVIDLKLRIDAASETVAVIAPTGAEGVIFNLIEAKVEGGNVSLYLGLGVGGEDKKLTTYPAGEWHRITVWITANGDKAAVFMDGDCITSDVALPDISAMTELHFADVGASASVLDRGAYGTPVDGEVTASLMLDDISITSASVFANAFNSAVLTPKVSATESAYTLSWKAANGALYYTVWRAGEDGVYTVIADKLKTNAYTDHYDGECSYKVTYAYGSLGIVLNSLPAGSGVVAKKPVPVIEPIVKLIDFSKPGTLGIVIVTGAAVFSMAIIYFIRVFVLKVDPAQPNRKKPE